MDTLEIIKKKNNLITKIRNKLRKDKYDEAIEIIENFKNNEGDDKNVEINSRQKYQQRGTRIEKDAERS